MGGKKKGGGGTYANWKLVEGKFSVLGSKDDASSQRRQETCAWGSGFNLRLKISELSASGQARHPMLPLWPMEPCRAGEAQEPIQPSSYHSSLPYSEPSCSLSRFILCASELASPCFQAWGRQGRHTGKHNQKKNENQTTNSQQLHRNLMAIQNHLLSQPCPFLQAPGSILEDLGQF